MARAPRTSREDRKILDEAKDRYHRAQEFYSTANHRFIEDVKFGYGDSENNWQWSEQDYNYRNPSVGTKRPTLTVNKTRQHCLQIVNDARQNKPGVNVRPVGGGASKEAAEVFEGVIRHIEYISNAQAAYDNATWSQVFGGWGYWRILTDYVDDETNDQEIFIRRVGNSMDVYLDPDVEEADGSDAKWGFIFKNMPRDQFDQTYPQYKDQVSKESALSENDEWCDEHHVRVAEYFRINERKSDRLLRLSSDDGDERLVKESDLGDALDSIPEEQVEHVRDLMEQRVEWFLLAGNSVLEKRPWLGKYIPLVRLPGEITVVNGQYDCRGHVRALRHPQQMYNFWCSAAAEYVANQSKSPYLAPVEAIEGYEEYWRNANTTAYSVLPYKHMSDAGQPIPPPTRVEPPVMPQAFISGLQMAQQEMMLVSGQYQAIMGAPSNEVSGKAINARQRQGDNATYHYIDRLAQAIRFTGRILIDLIPKVYDTERVIKIMSEDREQSDVVVSPDAEQAAQAQKHPDGDEKVIFNPSVGRYEVEADIGPAYGALRQEAFNAFSQIVAQNKEMGLLVGDLWMKNSDFPGSEEAAERLKRMLPPQALGGPTPQMQAMHAAAQKMMGDASQQVAKLQDLNTKLSEQLTKANMELQQTKGDRSSKAGLDVYDAETRRLATVAQIDKEAMMPVIRELVSQVLGTPIVPLMGVHAAADQARQPPPEQTNGAGPDNTGA